jgi:hypothetical protein
VPVGPEEVANPAVALLTAAILHVHGTSTGIHAKRLGLGLLRGILFPVVHFLHEGLRLFLVHK